MNSILNNIVDWIREDFRTHPFRFFVELVAWALSIATSVIFAATVPTPPFFLLYPMWISGCMMYAWAAWTRQSFGMLANYILLTTIDSIGLARLLLQ
jgi:hypothetical protein